MENKALILRNHSCVLDRIFLHSNYWHDLIHLARAYILFLDGFICSMCISWTSEENVATNTTKVLLFILDARYSTCI